MSTGRVIPGRAVPALSIGIFLNYSRYHANGPSREETFFFFTGVEAEYLARQRGARWGSPAPCARYVCDLHENARRYYRSIAPGGENELARLNLFEQVTRSAETARNVPRKKPIPARTAHSQIGHLRPICAAQRPFSATLAHA